MKFTHADSIPIFTERRRQGQGSVKVEGLASSGLLQPAAGWWRNPTIFSGRGDGITLWCHQTWRFENTNGSVKARKVTELNSVSSMAMFDDRRVPRKICWPFVMLVDDMNVNYATLVNNAMLSVQNCSQKVQKYGNLPICFGHYHDEQATGILRLFFPINKLVVYQSWSNFF